MLLGGDGHGRIWKLKMTLFALFQVMPYQPNRDSNESILSSYQNFWL